MQKLKYYIFTVELFCSQIFAGINGVMGRTFLSSEGDSSYMLFCMFFAIMSMAIVYSGFIHQRVKFSNEELFFLLSPIGIITIYFIDSPESPQALRMFQQYIIWAIPAISIAVYLLKEKTIRNMLKPLILFSLLILAGLCRTWIFGIAGALLEHETTGESYQAASYSAAFCYSIFLFTCLYRNMIPEIIARYRLLALPLMFICLIIIFITGGRGGMVMAIFSTLVLVYCYHKENRLSFRKKITIVAFILIGIIVLVSFIQSNPILSETSQRVFSYITEDGIDMSKTSHRDLAYSKAIKNIMLSPLFGHGFFNYFELNGNYPHNIFLEILLQGGLFYFSLFLVAFILFFRKLWNIFKISKSNIVFLLFLFYPLVNLNFSGSYISNGLFWFCLTYVTCMHSYRRITYKLKISLNERNIAHSQRFFDK